MKTADQREVEFRSDLEALLKKHKAEIDITDDGRSWGMHSGICRVSIDGVYDANGDVIAEYAEFLL